MTPRRGSRGRVVLLTGLFGLGLPTVLSACGSADASPDADDPMSLVSAGAVLLDVRSPAEFSREHLDGALNIDAESADFQDRIAVLDHDAAYLVYCRSGARAERAVATMEELGFSAVVNGGGLDDLVAEGLPTG